MLSKPSVCQMLFSFLLITLPLCTWGAPSGDKLLISASRQLSSNFVPAPCAIPLGTYGAEQDVYSVYQLPAHCQDFQPLQDAKIVAMPDTDVSQVFYVQEAAVDKSIRGHEPPFSDALEKFIVNINDRTPFRQRHENQQQPLGSPTTNNVIHQTATSALVIVPNDLLAEIDVLLPRFLIPLQIPLQTSDIPVPVESVNRVQTWLDSLKFDSQIAVIVDSISEQDLLKNIQFLTGEDSSSGIVSRHSFTEGARIASQWIKSHFGGSGLRCGFQSFLVGFAPNVICEYPALTNISENLIFGAHYDSRGSFGSLRAPGADDDGSGTGALLEIARTIKRNGITFNSNVKFAAFSGEEQGLLGSRAYAKSLRNQNVDVAMMIQADMLGYHSPEEPPQLGYTPSVGTLEVAYLITNVSALYSPELTVGPTQACCSDHQRFHEQGYAAMQIFERAGPIIDPMYHNSGDLTNRDGFDVKQIRSIAKVNLAAVLHAAGYTSA